MIIKKILCIPTSTADIHIDFGIAESSDMDKIFELRHAVYKKYGYFDLEESSGKDIDAFDTNNTIYVVAKRGERFLAAIRAVPGPDLPIHHFFKISEMHPVRTESMYEFGRLVVHRTEDDSEIPKNIILLMLIHVTIDACADRCSLGVAYIKTKLLKKLHLLKFPLHQYKNYECIYPQDGKLHNYFYSVDDPPVPSYFQPDEVVQFSNDTFSNKNLFRVAGNIYTLQNTFYKMFLKKMGIL